VGNNADAGAATGAGGARAGYAEYSRGEVLQMVGRAGRPQFDTEVRLCVCGGWGEACGGMCVLCLPRGNLRVLWHPNNQTKHQSKHQKGVAVVMTLASSAARYAELAAGAEAVESTLHETAAEHLNGAVGCSFMCVCVIACQPYLSYKRSPSTTNDTNHNPRQQPRSSWAPSAT
jgi:hypothetical protein